MVRGNERFTPEDKIMTALTNDDMASIAEAAAAGRVATLVVEAETQIPGRFDAATGRVERAELSEPKVDDLLDDLVELVASKGGDVLVVPAESMPSRTKLAAIYRY
jgi:hypothetical protein